MPRAGAGRWAAPVVRRYRGPVWDDEHPLGERRIAGNGGFTARVVGGQRMIVDDPGRAPTSERGVRGVAHGPDGQPRFCVVGWTRDREGLGRLVEAVLDDLEARVLEGEWRLDGQLLRCYPVRISS